MKSDDRSRWRVRLLFPLVWVAACIPESNPGPGRRGDDDFGPCAIDCATVATPQCKVAVCNTGQELGPINTCVVIASPAGTACDDGLFCTVNDACAGGTCVGGPANDCGLTPSECAAVFCDEETAACDLTPANESATCTPADLCQINGVCLLGDCVGAAKDCSAFDDGCQVGACNAADGLCYPTPAADGTACNDHDACTEADQCLAGECGGAPVVGCQTLLQTSFETCPSGWTLGSDWQCGTPTNVGPLTAHTGQGVIATQLAGPYSVNQTFATAFADSPPIDLSLATNPTVSFWVWYHTEGGTFDGWNLQISTNEGQSFNIVTTVTPAYSLTIAGNPAWGGDRSADGWSRFDADLISYVGHQVILRFAFRSDGASVFPGLYVDDLVVAEPAQNPLTIVATSPLPDAYSGADYSAQLVRAGGTTDAVWNILPGGLNTAWLAIDPATGELGGTPAAEEIGPARLTVHVEEPTLPSNFDEATFTLVVNPVAFITRFEGACPDGWTLSGDWQCGSPTGVGPATAFSGTQCLATQLGSTYNDLQTWSSTTATSPDIDLTSALAPILLTFRMWIDTEGATYDGVNLRVSDDGGAQYSIVSTVTPTYPLTIAGVPAWGGHQSGLGWQLVQADLSAYAGRTIRLRFAFQSDSSGAFPGVYIDDVRVGIAN